MRFLGPSTSSRAHSCGSRYRLSPSVNLFASTYHEFEDNNLAAFYLRYVHNLRVCSYLARSSCGILTRLLYVVCTYLYSRFCPAGISEGFLLALRISMFVCVYTRVFPPELAVQNVVDFFVSTYHELVDTNFGYLLLA